jgi:SAM-dependent methyltransferase
MTDPRLPEEGTVRRTITDFVLEWKHLLRAPVLEVGSRRCEGSWWADLRAQTEFEGHWIGADMQPGPHVDIVSDLTNRDALEEYEEFFGSCLCVETFEHVTYPAKMLDTIHWALKPGAWIIITTPFAFPVHEFPNDYWRFTPSGLELLLTDAGFIDIQTFERAVVTDAYFDHDDEGVLRKLPGSVCAIARKEPK